MTKDEADEQAKTLNAYGKKKFQRCHACGGDGREWMPLYGDEALGYAPVGSCKTCKGTGLEPL